MISSADLEQLDRILAEHERRRRLEWISSAYRRESDLFSSIKFGEVLRKFELNKSFFEHIDIRPPEGRQKDIEPGDDAEIDLFLNSFQKRM